MTTVLNRLIMPADGINNRRNDYSQNTLQLGNIFKTLAVHLQDGIKRSLDACQRLTNKSGIYSTIEMKAAGFEYTGQSDTACCKHCALELSDWTLEIKPFARHVQERPSCPFVLSLMPKGTTIPPQPTTMSSPNQTLFSCTAKQNNDDRASSLHGLNEAETLKQGRKRSYAHWSKETKPSPHQLIQAGFFSCNVGDRVMCCYCNLICQQWTPDTDDPFEIHQKLSPKCPFVVALQKSSQPSNLLIVNEHMNTDQTQANRSRSSEPFRWHEVIVTAACNPNYIEMPRREASFSTWPKENLPSVESLVRSGFFYAGTKTIVTCFYCNGSLQNWGPKDDPRIEHARWFPHCAYAKQLCGEELYRRIQESKKAQQERTRAQNTNEGSDQSVNQSSRPGLNIPDESTLSRLVAARLDLPVSQRLLDKNFKLSVIKRCWEDQLRLKRDDFQYVNDLLIACIILQKQIDHIGGRKEKITIPSVAMNKLHEEEQKEAKRREQEIATNSVAASRTGDDSPMSSSTESISTSPISTTDNKKNSVIGQSSKNTGSSDATLCLLCMEDERRLACIPCGHLVACVPCAHSVRSCPVCRHEIQAFVRVYL